MKIMCLAIAIIGLTAVNPANAQQPMAVKIVGIGATSCRSFVEQATPDRSSQRQYLAWMQGYMSGIVIARPVGVDEGIDLNPKTFPLAQQIKFIRDYCLNAPSDSFADAVEALFKKLRSISST